MEFFLPIHSSIVLELTYLVIQVCYDENIITLSLSRKETIFYGSKLVKLEH